MYPGQPPNPSYPGQYGAPPSGYGAPAGQYGAPPGGYPGGGAVPPYGGGYGAPAGAYGAPGGAYGAPGGAYGAPGGYPGGPVPGGYNAPGGYVAPGGYGAPAGYGAPPGAYPGTVPGGAYPGAVPGAYGAPTGAYPGGAVPGAYPGAVPGAYGAPPGVYPQPGAAGVVTQVGTSAVVTPGGATVSTTTTTTIPVVFMPTFAYPNNDPMADAQRLRKSMKGLGTDDSTLINIMTNRSKAQLAQIAEIYLREFKHSLEKDIVGDTSGHYCTLLCDLIKPVTAYKAENLRKAVKGVGTRESILIDVLTQSSNAEIAYIKSMYPDVEKNISNDTSFNFRKVLLELLKGTREEITFIDDVRAERVALEIYQAGEARAGTNDSKFVNIMTTYSPYFLDRVNYHYTRNHGHSLYKAIEKETSGDYMHALIACTKPPDIYFADRLKQAMKGIGTDDWGLVYIFAVHDKAQLKHISNIYTQRHGSLAHDIEKDTSGNYRKSLLSLLA